MLNGSENDDLRSRQSAVTTTKSANLVKHTSRNPLLRYLICRFQETCSHLLRELDISTVLEVGCGEGFFMRYLHQRFPRWEMKGSDLSDSAIAYAQQLLPEARFAVEDIYRLSDADNAYDLVIASEVLEHLEDPAAALSEIVRTSRRYVLLSVPNEPAFQLTNFARGKYLRRWGNHPEHIQHWSRGRFAEFVSTQCHVISTSSSFPWTIVLAAKRA